MTQHTNPVPVTAEDEACRDDLVCLIKEGVLDRAGKREIDISDVERRFLERIARHRLASTPADAQGGEGLVDKLVGYAVHDDDCRRVTGYGDRKCTCGFADVMGEVATLRTAADPEPAGQLVEWKYSREEAALLQANIKPAGAQEVVDRKSFRLGYCAGQNDADCYIEDEDAAYSTALAALPQPPADEVK